MHQLTLAVHADCIAQTVQSDTYELPREIHTPHNTANICGAMGRPDGGPLGFVTLSYPGVTRQPKYCLLTRPKGRLVTATWNLIGFLRPGTDHPWMGSAWPTGQRTPNPHEARPRPAQAQVLNMVYTHASPCLTSSGGEMKYTGFKQSS